MLLGKGLAGIPRPCQLFCQREKKPQPFRRERRLPISRCCQVFVLSWVDLNDFCPGPKLPGMALRQHWRGSWPLPLCSPGLGQPCPASPDCQPSYWALQGRTCTGRKDLGQTLLPQSCAWGRNKNASSCGLCLPRAGNRPLPDRAVLRPLSCQPPVQSPAWAQKAGDAPGKRLLSCLIRGETALVGGRSIFPIHAGLVLL